MGVTVVPYGERALLVELDSLRSVLRLHRAMTGPQRPGALADAVPGARTLLLIATSVEELRAVRRAAEQALAAIRDEHEDPCRRVTEGDDVGQSERVSDEVTVIEVRYDGADLQDVGRATGLSPAEVVSAHTGRDWTVGFAGFTPGFAYLVGGDPRLRVPRRDSPRPRVPQGAVALAGEFTGIYPRASPGGWQLIGSTEAPVWDADRIPPALLLAGRRVRFVDVEATS